jgi:hypothetical protein
MNTQECIIRNNFSEENLSRFRKNIMETLVTKIKSAIENNLPTKLFHIEVSETKGAFGGNYVRIIISAKNIDMNNIRYQQPQIVSLLLNKDTLELEPQIFNGSGGRRVMRNPNLNLDSEKYLCMFGEKIPFRKPKPNEESVLKAIEKFTQGYVKLLIQFKDVLRYSEIVDYNQLLNV